MAKAKPDVAQQIVQAITVDLNDRCGLHLDSLDDETLREIHATWLAIIRELLARKGK